MFYQSVTTLLAVALMIVDGTEDITQPAPEIIGIRLQIQDERRCQSAYKIFGVKRKKT
ncbi:MAG: hypothetical protein WBG50_08195 [Desulfomonilaceae bacterium]